MKNNKMVVVKVKIIYGVWKVCWVMGRIGELGV